MRGYTILPGGRMVAPDTDYQPSDHTVVFDTLHDFLAVRDFACPVWAGGQVREATAEELAEWAEQEKNARLTAAAEAAMAAHPEIADRMEDLADCMVQAAVLGAELPNDRVPSWAEVAAALQAIDSLGAVRLYARGLAVWHDVERWCRDFGDAYELSPYLMALMTGGK